MDSKLEFPHGSKRDWDDQVAHLISKSESGDSAATAALLNWFKDGNWPGSLRACNHILQYWRKVIPEIKKILRSDDEMWQHWLILGVLDRLSVEDVSVFEAEITTLALRPSEDIVDLNAGEILSRSNTISTKTMHRILGLLELRHPNQLEKLEQIKKNTDSQ